MKVLSNIVLMLCSLLFCTTLFLNIFYQIRIEVGGFNFNRVHGAWCVSSATILWLYLINFNALKWHSKVFVGSFITVFLTSLSTIIFDALGQGHHWKAHMLMGASLGIIISIKKYDTFSKQSEINEISTD